MTNEDKPTGAPPQTVEGVTFRCFKVGIQETEWRSDDGRCKAGRYGLRQAFWATVDGKGITSDADPINWKHFRSLENAMRAAVKGARTAAKVAQ